MRQKPRCRDPNPLSSSSTCLDLAKQRTEGWAARGRGFVCLDNLHCSELQTLEQVWEALERLMFDRPDIGEHQLSHSSISHQREHPASSEHWFLILEQLRPHALVGRASWAHRFQCTLRNSIHLAWKLTKQLDASFKVALVWHFSPVWGNSKAPFKSPLWVRDQPLAKLGTLLLGPSPHISLKAICIEDL